jgi:hypothetical protein
LLEWPAYGTPKYESLLLSAIIFYARPFSSNERNQDAKATSHVDCQVLDHLNPEEVTLHEKILNLRNKAVAHAEWDYHPTNLSKDYVITSMPFSIWKYFPGSSDIAAFASLVAKVHRRVHELSGNRPDGRH